MMHSRISSQLSRKFIISFLYLSTAHAIQLSWTLEHMIIRDAFRDLVPFVQFKNVKNTH